MPARSTSAAAHVGRYELHEAIASGGMGSVHLGRLSGAAGFSRLVAIKRLNPLLARDPEFVKMFLDEARLAGRVRHPNVVPSFDVVEADGEVLLVMEYVHGESLAGLLRLSAERGVAVPMPIATAIMSGVLYGLHAAHEATDEQGEPLGLVHRDVSPQNVLVGADGVARVVDFGVAKATGRLQTTGHGRLKGKLAYMPPEQLRGGKDLDRRADVYAAGVVLWEVLAGQRLFLGDNEGDTIAMVLFGDVDPPSAKRPDIPPALDALVLRAVSRHPADRFATAREMGAALLDVCAAAPPHDVGEWVEGCAHELLTERAARVAELESAARAKSSGGSRRAIAATTDAAGSQVSSISVAVPGAAASPRRQRRALAFGASVVGGVLAIALLRPWRAPTHREDAATASASPTQIAPQADSSPIAASSAIAEPAAELTAPVPNAEPSAAAAKRTPATVRPAAPHPTTAPARRPDCDPPFTRAPDGRKIWRRECFAQPQ